MAFINRLVTAASISLALSAVACGDSKEKKRAPDSAGGAGGTTGGSAGTPPLGGEGGQMETTNAGGATSTTSNSTTGAGGAPPSAEGGMGGEAGASVTVPPTAEAGYIDLEPYTFDGGPELASLTTSSARLFYAFQKADESPETRPLFVFTGGIPDPSTGSTLPGPATTGLFAVLGVGRMSLSENDFGAGLSSNATSWTEMGNLLFVDGRQSGFSYARLDDPADDGARGIEFASNNFNNFTDAADMVRALLRFFLTHPELADNPVVFVGQGYASIRTTLMLSYLLYPERLLAASDWSYSDEDLADEIIDHHANISPNSGLDPAALSNQFGWQVQIQPKLGGAHERFSDDLACQPGTPEAEAAEVLGEACPPPSRDLLHLDRSAGWSLELRQASSRALTDPSSFQAALFLAPDDIEGLPAADRHGAYRLSTMLATEGVFPTAPAAWIELLGMLQAHDRYYIADASRLIAGNSNFTEGNDPACLMFIETAQHVATFLTNAHFDGYLRADAVATTLADCANYTPTPILESAVHDEEPRAGITRPGWLTLQYNEAAPLGPVTRTLRMPGYPQAGHLVSVSAPLELRQDVRVFLRESGLPGVE